MCASRYADPQQRIRLDLQLLTSVLQTGARVVMPTVKNKAFYDLSPQLPGRRGNILASLDALGL